MNNHRQKILELANSYNIAEMTLAEIGEKIGGISPQLVKHHIDQLVKKGFLWIDRKEGKMKLLTSQNNSISIKIPILGSADCGPAAQYADGANPEGFVSIAPKLLNLKSNKTYFAVHASGSSMNRSKVRTFGDQFVGIDDGDLVIVESGLPDINNKPYIVAVIDGLANIKKLVIEQYVARLESESTEKYMPIYLEVDQTDFIAGKVVAVVKG